MTDTAPVDTRKDYIFILEDNPEAIESISSQEILHAVDPKLAAKTKTMPKGSSMADFWMLKNGDPLTSVNAALALAGLAGEVYQFKCRVTNTVHNPWASVHIEFRDGNEVTEYHAEAKSLPAAITAAVLKYSVKKGVSV